MRNIKLTLKYDGSCFHGWQVQPNAVTVQQTLGDAVQRVTGSTGRLTGCSRTDSGVHALMFVCGLQSDTALPCDRLLCALNAVLPHSVAVTDCREAEPSFHARYHCKSKQYRYVIWNSPVKDPFSVGYAYHYKHRLDEKMLNEQAKDFIGTYDFSAFCAAGASTLDNTRTIYDFSVEREGDRVIFTVRGNGFLYNMVRIMVGTLLGISQGKLMKGSIPEIIQSGKRENAGVTAPPQGLYLEKVEY